MFSDIRHDFYRYRDYLGCKPNFKFINIIYVLIKSPSFYPIINHRFGFWVNDNFKESKSHLLKHFLKIFYFLGKYLSVCFSKIDIGISSEIGEGLLLSNKGNIILGINKMGRNCTIHHNVTFGMDNKGDLAKLGDNIWVGPDSVIFGDIDIGDNVVIAGSTVLSKNVISNSLVGGNPCRLLKKDIEDGPYNFNLEINKK
jgi:serine acetyltransferase